ncbi:MAG TPA: amidase family protein [Polyangiaceae bacterium]|nr:amidase family protein [Polyangiaceae bacterium]
MHELCSKPATELASLLAHGEVSSVELTRAHLARIDAVDGALRAFTEVFREGALADAERADVERRRGDARGPLHGLPVSVKECLDLEGRATTMGVQARVRHRAREDAALVKLLRRAGAVVLGRTNVSQFLLYYESYNPVFGRTSNPHRAERTPGGSSGGEAAAIAAGLSPLGVGTDIGGSIRVPAHMCGIAGLKPTVNRWPNRGVAMPLPGQGAVPEQAGPMARTVGDVELAMRALPPEWLNEVDPNVPPVLWGGPSADRLERLRVGVFVDDGLLAPSRAVARAVERAAEVLRARGCEVVAFEPPPAAEVVATYLGALSADGGRSLSEAAEGGELEPPLRTLRAASAMPAAARALLARGLSLAGERRAAAVLAALGEKSVAALWALSERLREQQRALFDALDAAGVDALVCPPFATPALGHGQSQDFLAAGGYAILWNALRCPAGVVPVTTVRPGEAERPPGVDRVDKQAAAVDRGSEGLPVGVQIVARPWADERVVALMRAVEEGVARDAGRPRTPVDPAPAA